MIRNPFSKSHGSKKSAISKTAEREFEREIKKIEQLEENSKQLYKDIKSYTEAQQAQCKQEIKISQELMNCPLYIDEKELRRSVGSWNRTAQHLEFLTHELNSVTHKTMVEPIKKLGTVFPCIQVAAKKREQSLQEFSKCQNKVDKYQEKERTGANIVKLESNRRSLYLAKEDFEKQNSALMEDLPAFYEGRIDYLQPSFQAMIKAQVKYYTEAHKLYTELSDSVEGSPDSDATDYKQKIQQKLASIRALSITSDD